MDNLLKRVNRILEKDYTHKSLFETIEALASKVEAFEEENSMMAEKHAERDIQFNQFVQIIEEQTLQIKEMKQNGRLINFYKMAEENFHLAQEISRLREKLEGVEIG